MSNLFVKLMVLAVLAGAGTTASTDWLKTMPLPENYREWVWLSSGLGMSYSAGGNDGSPSFDNVFVTPEAYKAFKTSGTWPDHTVLMLEVRKSDSQSSINQSGHFQTERVGLEAHVKDERMPGKWAFYSFGDGSKTGTFISKDASCYSCHEQHGIVDTTFVQFYPTLLDIAKAKGTVKH